MRYFKPTAADGKYLLLFLYFLQDALKKMTTVKIPRFSGDDGGVAIFVSCSSSSSFQQKKKKGLCATIIATRQTSSIRAHDNDLRRWKVAPLIRMIIGEVQRMKITFILAHWSKKYLQICIAEELKPSTKRKTWNLTFIHKMLINMVDTTATL